MEGLSRVHPPNNLGMLSMSNVHYAIFSDFYLIGHATDYRYSRLFNYFHLANAHHFTLYLLVHHNYESWNH